MATDPSIILAAGRGLTPIQSPLEAQQEALKLRMMQQTIRSNQALEQDRTLIAAQRVRQQAGNEALAASIKKHSTTDPNGEDPVDYHAVAQDLEAAGFPELANSYLKGQNENVEALGKIWKTGQEHAKAKVAAIGDLAYGAQSVEDFTARVGMAATYGLLGQTPQENEQVARQVVGQVQAAGPDGWQAVANHFRQFSPRWQAEQNPKTAAEISHLGAQTAEIQQKIANPIPTPGAMDARAQTLYTKQAQGQALTPAEAGELKGYEMRKRVISDPTQLAATERATAAQKFAADQQARSQTFTEAQAGRKDLQAIESKRADALSAAQELRDVVASARSGNKISAQLQPLLTTIAAIRSQGLNRINAVEIGVTGNAGSLWDRIQAWAGKAESGQPVPENLQKDMEQFAGMLEKNAHTKYLQQHQSIVRQYGEVLKNVQPLPAPQAPEASGGSGPGVPGLPGGLSIDDAWAAYQAAQNKKKKP